MSWTKQAHRTPKKINDGDTFSLFKGINGSQYVRLVGVDTPERGERGYPNAKRYLQNLIANKPVTIKPVARDVYGRIVAEVYCNRQSVNKKIRQRGW
jgi:micrococcal nuclease